MQDISLNNWLASYANKHSLVLVANNFCQYQLKFILKQKYLAKPVTVLTIKQLIIFLLNNCFDRSSYIINNTVANYYFRKNYQALSNLDNYFNKYLLLGYYNGLPNQIKWPEHTGNIIDQNFIDAYWEELTSNNQLDEVMAINWLLRCNNYTWDSILLISNSNPKPLEFGLIKSCSSLIYIEKTLNSHHLEHQIYADLNQEYNGVITQVIQEHLIDSDKNLAIVTTNYQDNLKLYQALVLSAKISNIDLTDKVIYSCPQNLLAYPAIQTVIWLLEQFIQPNFNIQHWLYHLRSKRIITKFTNASLIIQELQQLDRHYLSWQELTTINQEVLEEFFIKIWQDYQLIQSNDKLDLINWSIIFDKIIYNWGCLDINSNYHPATELIDAWKKSWLQWLNLDQNQLFNCETALFWLKKFNKNSLFQYSQKLDQAKIFIITQSELLSQQYSKVWAVNMHSDNFPNKINTFDIPKNICEQQGLGLNLMLEYKLFNNPVISSHSIKIENTIKQISKCVPTLNITYKSFPSIYNQAINTKLDKFIDNSMFNNLKINNSLLKNFNACSFKAVALHNLQLPEPSVLSFALSPRIKGNILHASLAKIWQVLQNSNKLKALSNSELEILVTATVTKITQQLAKQPNWSLSAILTQLEIKLLSQNIIKWLELEANRSDFSIISIEAPLAFNYKQYQIKLRVDRIDSTPQGNIIIDYKTGKSSINDWLDLQPNDPQMLLYLLAHEADVAGIYYAQINNKKIAKVGIDHTNFNKHTDSECWQEQKAIWRNTIEANITACSNIAPRLNPKTLQSCNQCHLHALCRVYEQESR